MAQKAKNQKNKNNSAKAKPKKAAKAASSNKAKPKPVKIKTVKKAQKAKPTVKKNSAKPSAKAVASPKKAKVQPKSALKPKPELRQKVVAPKTAPSPVKQAKGKKEAIVAITQPLTTKPNGAAVKKPVPGQGQRRIHAKPQKKVFRSELIFPNQLKETPLLKGKNKPEPKGKFVLEFLVKSSPTLLFDFLSTPSGLSEWFADDVDIRNEEFTFHWDGQVQRAKLLAYKQDHLLRLRWVDKNEDFYFEFRIDVDDLTGDVTLILTDFGESEDDIRTSKLLWESQIGKLLKVLGAY